MTFVGSLLHCVTVIYLDFYTLNAPPRLKKRIMLLRVVVFVSHPALSVAVSRAGNIFIY